MITLAAADTFQGKAGTATAITYLIDGMERNTTTGAETYKTLGQGQLGTSTAALYTVPATTQGFIRTIQLSNTTAGAITCTFYVNGTAAANQAKSFSIPASGSAEYVNGWRIFDSSGGLVQTLGLTLTGDVTGTGAGTIATTLASIGAATGPLGTAARTNTVTIDAKGRVTALTDQAIAITSGAVTDFNEAAQDAVGNILTDSPTTNFTYNDGANTITAISGPYVNVQDNSYASAVLPANSAATNRTNLLALFAAAPNGSTLFFPGGTYNFDQNMNVGAKYFTFLGEGVQLAGGFTILAIGTGTAGLLTLTSGNWYTTFRNITFAATTTQLTSAMVTVNDNVSVNFTACAFAALGGQLNNCIDYTGTTASANTTVIDSCFVSGFKGVGVNVASNGASLVINNTIIQGQWGSTVQLATAGVQVGEAGALQVDNSDIIGCVNNMLINPVAGKVVASVYVTNTYMDFAGGSCLKISGAGATVRCRFIAVSFTCANSFTGQSSVEVSTTVAAGAQGIDFENCSMLNTFGQTGTTNGILVTGAADISIIACRVAGWTNGIQITPFGAAGTTQPFITDNTIGPTGGIGANGTGIVLNVGGTTYGSTLIQNNILTGNTTAPMTDASTHTVAASKLISGNAGWMAGAGDLVPLSSAGAARLASTRGAATAGTVDTFLFTFRMPANSVSVGQKYQIRLVGQASAAGNITVTIRGGPNGTIAGDTVISANTAAAVALNGYGTFDGLAQVVALGATGNIAATGNLFVTAYSTKTAAAEVVANAPTTAAWFITVSATASAGVFTVREAAVIAL